MPKRILTGTVTSDKNDQTITVLVERRFTHPVLKKTVRRSKKYRAHDAQNQFKVGDSFPMKIIKIQEADKKIGLSIRAVKSDEVQRDMESYRESAGDEPSTTLGDAFRAAAAKDKKDEE